MGKTVKAIVAIVAIAAVIYFAPELAPALMSLGIPSAVASAIATIVVSTVISVGASMIFKALGIGGVPSAKAQIGPPQVFRQAISDSFIVYGKRRVGGLLVFFHGLVSGGDHYRYFVIAVAGHQCKGLVTWMLGDAAVTVDGTGKVTSGDYANAAWLWFERGTPTDAANSTFVSECGGNWTSAHQGKGVAKIYAKFKLTDAVVQAGMPNITAVIEGRDEILDPRDGSTGYQRNAALVFYDWMSMPREDGGFGIFDDEMPSDDWISAQANVCDEVVNGAPRYAFDAYLTTGAAPSEVRDSMIVNCAGTYTYSAGKHLMRVGYWVPVSATLSEDDLAGPIQVSPFLSADSSSTEVQGTFIDPANGYQGSPFTTWDLPGADSVQQVDLDLAHTTNLDQANRVAAIMGKRAACEKTVVWPMNLAGLNTGALDNVQIASSRYGLDNYAWQIANFGLTSDFGVVLALREENSEIYGDPTPVTPVTPPTIVGGTPVPTGTTAALRSSYPKSLRVTASDAGTSATVTLDGGSSGAAFTIDYATAPPVDVSVAAGSITGLAYSTTYFLFADVDGVGDTAPTYGATTVYGDALNSAAHPLRVFMGQSVVTPGSGGTTTTGGGGGGGYSGGGYTPPSGGTGGTSYP